MPSAGLSQSHTCNCNLGDHSSVKHEQPLITLFSVGLEGSKRGAVSFQLSFKGSSVPCLSCSYYCMGNGNETISNLCRLMLCSEDLLELSALIHKQSEMSAVSLSVKCLLHRNQRDVKSMLIGLALRKCCSLQKGDDHSESTISSCLRYHAPIPAIYQNISDKLLWSARRRWVQRFTLNNNTENCLCKVVSANL